MTDSYRKSDFNQKRGEYPGVFNSKEEDNDFLAHHNQELIMKGIDPRTGKVFNPYLTKVAADNGDPDAKRAYHEFVYQQFTDSIHPNLNHLINVGYSRIQKQKIKFVNRDFRTRRT